MSPAERSAAIRECATVLERGRAALRLATIEVYLANAALWARMRDFQQRIIDKGAP